MRLEGGNGLVGLYPGNKLVAGLRMRPLFSLSHWQKWSQL